MQGTINRLCRRHKPPSSRPPSSQQGVAARSSKLPSLTALTWQLPLLLCFGMHYHGNSYPCCVLNACTHTLTWHLRLLLRFLIVLLLKAHGSAHIPDAIYVSCDRALCFTATAFCAQKRLHAPQCAMSRPCLAAAPRRELPCFVLHGL